MDRMHRQKWNEASEIILFYCVKLSWWVYECKRESRDREGVAILLNDKWHNAVIDFGRVSSRILWIKFKFFRVTVCVMVGYGPSKEDVEERDRFWIE